MRRATLVAISFGAWCGHNLPTAQAAAAPATAPPVIASPAAASQPPRARTEAVVEEIFGIRVSDPYRWMETGGDELLAWMRAQSIHTAAYLADRPGRDALLARLVTLGAGTSSIAKLRVAGGRTFFTRIAAGAQLATLIVRDAGGNERVLVDPARLSSDGGHVALGEWAPSPDGALLAYDLAIGGGEISTIYVMDVETGKPRPDVIGPVWGESTATWLPDGKSFFYSQLPEAGPDVDQLQNWTIRLHVLGTPQTEDVTVLAGHKGSFPLAPSDLAFALAGSSEWVIAAAGGARSEVRVAIARIADLDRSSVGKTPWRVVAEYADGIEDAQIHGDRLYLLSFKDASNRKIVSVGLADPVLAKARIELPEDPKATIAGMAIAKDALYVRRMIAGRGNLLRKPWKKNAAVTLALPVEAWTSDVVADPEANGAVVRLDQWTQPAAYYRHDGNSGSMTPLGLAETSTADTSGLLAEEVSVTSSDGTAVPLSILRRRDLALDGTNPALVVGYGAYGTAMTASFGASRLAWLELGGVTAICHVRGGGENGHRWQLDGSREKKLNGVHDFVACAEYLVAKRYTTNAKMFAQGTSAGGILVGRALTLRPDLFAGVNLRVAMANPVRMLESPNGANQIAEFGDPNKEQGFRHLLAMDPYQHVTGGTRYPAILVAVGLNDNRVPPWMGAKIAARLAAATVSGQPVLVRVEGDAGHGVGSTRNQLYGEAADYYSFFLALAGRKEFQKSR